MLLKDTEEQLRTLIDHLPDYIVFRDEQGRWIEANDAAIRLFGLDKTSYQGKKSSELAQEFPYYRDNFFTCTDSDEKTWNAGKTLKFEEIIDFPNEQVKVFTIKKVPVFNEDGSRKGLLVIGKDITEQKESERESRLFSKIVEQTNDGIMVTDAKGKILSINPAFSSVTGYYSEEIIGKRPNVLKSGIHGKEFYHYLWSSLYQKGYWEGEIWNKRKNGEIFAEWLTISSIKDEDGAVKNYVAVFKDISEQIKIKKDIILTGNIQRQLLPADHQNQNIEIKTIYKPSRYVSGDFFEYIWNKDKTVLFGYVLDFMGHGMATAIQFSALRVLFHQVVEKDIPLQEKLDWINKESFKYFSEETFVAAICFELDFSSKQLTFSSAGINYFLMSSPSCGIHVIKVPGTFLGIMEDARYEQKTFPIYEGDQLFFLSDGLFDILPEDLKSGNKSFECIIQDLFDLAYNNICKDDVSAMCLKIKVD